MLFVTDRADGGATVHVYLADFAGTQAQLRIVSLARQQLHRCAGRTSQLRPFARKHFHTMNGTAYRDVAQRQRIAVLDRRIATTNQLHPCNNALGGDDVTAFSIRIAKQCQVGAAVRIIFQSLDFGENAILVATKIHLAVMLLMTATHVTGSNVTVVIASGGMVLLLHQFRVGRTLVQVWINHFNDCAASGRSRFDFNQCHYLASPCAISAKFIS